MGKSRGRWVRSRLGVRKTEAKVSSRTARASPLSPVKKNAQSGCKADSKRTRYDTALPQVGTLNTCEVKKVAGQIASQQGAIRERRKNHNKYGLDIGTARRIQQVFDADGRVRWMRLNSVACITRAITTASFAGSQFSVGFDALPKHLCA
jgi:hypothetical protein